MPAFLAKLGVVVVLTEDSFQSIYKSNSKLNTSVINNRVLLLVSTMIVAKLFGQAKIDVTRVGHSSQDLIYPIRNYSRNF